MPTCRDQTLPAFRVLSVPSTALPTTAPERLRSSSRRLPVYAVRVGSLLAGVLAGGDTMIGVRALALPGTYLVMARPRCVAALALPMRVRYTIPFPIRAGISPTIISVTSQPA